jgi:hypothetical protein
MSYGQHIIAICNDDNQLALVVIDSPTSTYGAYHSWNAKVLTHVSLAPDPGSMFSTPSFFHDTSKQQKHISHVSWSPWIIRGDSFYSVIVYVTNKDVRARVVTYIHNSVSLGDEVVYPHIEMRYNGPLKWHPTINKDSLSLALFTASGLVYLKISTQDASIIERATHDLDGRWDSVSGAIWDAAQRSRPRLHFSSLLSTIQSPTSVLEASSSELTALGCPSWRDQIENSAVLFSAKNDLKGNTKMKVWGMVTSPLGDFIATCHSVHPSDMIEYGSPNDRRGTVAVSALRQYQNMRNEFPRRDVSAEGVFFTLKKLVENTLEDSDQMPAFIEEIAGKLVQTYGPIDESCENKSVSLLTLDTENLDVLVKEFKQMAFFDQYTLKDRYTILASYACNTKCTIDLQRTLIAYRLATVSQDLPAALSEMPFSAEVRYQHQKMIALIRKLMETETSHAETTPAANADPLPEHTERDTNAIILSLPIDNLSNSVNSGLADTIADTCDFCSAPIPSTDLLIASCTNGHQFPRCGLTFLAIQAPGITKYCGICSTPFLNEDFVIAQETEVRPEHVVKQVPANKKADASLDNDTPTSLQMNGNRQNDLDNEGDVPVASNQSKEGQGQRSRAEPNQAIPVELDDVAVEEKKRELPITLARVLFLACDACIYCGGKFVD